MSRLSLAFIGTGVMGRSMAGHLLKAGHTLHVFNRTKARAQSLLDAGAHWHDTAGAAAAVAMRWASLGLEVVMSTSTAPGRARASTPAGPK